jgi:transcriptional regulator GlxA family with amidase domain
MLRFAILSADGAINAPLAVTLDMIHAVSVLVPEVQIEVCLFGAAGDGAASIAPSSIRPLETARSGVWDAVIIPGLGHAHARAPAGLLENDTGALLCSIIGSVHAQGAHVAASCTGTFAVAKTGLLDGAPATTSWWLAPHFRTAFPAVLLDEQALVCEHDRVLTGGGALAHIELMQSLLRKFVDPTVVEAMAGYIVSPRRGPQSAHSSVTQIAIADPVVAAFVQNIAAHLDQAVPVAILCAMISTTPRTLERRVRQCFGTTPTGLVQRMRAEAAMHLLRTTRLPLKTICEQVGYQDENSLRQLLLRTTGLTPRAIRSLG